MLPTSPRELAACIDHTLLRPEATARDIERLCAEALQAGFHAVCVNGSRVAFARRSLAGSPVRVAAVVGFPLGAMTTRMKALEAEAAVADGAAEIDVVFALGQMRDGALDHVRRDLAEVVKASGSVGVKAILECGLLTPGEQEVACRLAVEAGVVMVGTSTGVGAYVVTRDDVRRLRGCLPGKFGVKAEGGIRDLTEALALLEAGATRLGTTAGIALVQDMIRGGGDTAE